MSAIGVCGSVRPSSLAGEARWGPTAGSGLLPGGGGVAVGAAKLLGLLGVSGVFGVVLVDNAGVAGGELQFLFGGDARLQLSAAFGFGVEFGAEQQRQVRDPQPE